MFAELIQKIQGLAVEASAATIVRDDDLPGKAWLQFGGTVQEVAVPPVPRAHVVYDLESLIAALADDRICPDPEVFVASGSVRAVCDRDDRHEYVILEMPISQRFETLQAIEKGQRFTQREAIRLLRYGLHGCVGIDRVLAGLRRLDFKRTSSGKSHIEHGAESLGRSVEKSVQRAEEIPDQFSVHARVYAAHGCSVVAEIQVGLELDLESEAVILQTLPDELATARQKALREVAENIRVSLAGRGLTVPVLVGEF
jgi:hypothetical protein